MYSGSCLCNGVRYTITGQVSEFGYCHCASCRKASGSAFGANIGVARDDVQLSDPHNLCREFESSPGKFRVFCSRCGSPLYAYLNRTPETIRMRLGSLDTALGKTAKAHTFVADKADWEEIGGDLPQFDAWADRRVLVQAGSRQD